MNIKWPRFILFSLTVMIPGLQAYDSFEAPSTHDLLFLPVKMTPSGLELFFESVYNTKQYSEEFLPNNFSHMTQFLQHAKEEAQGDREYIKATFSLFGQKLKGCEYANAYKFCYLIHELPELIGYTFVSSAKSEEEKRMAIRQILSDGFFNNWRSFKTDPKMFMNRLSDDLLRAADPDAYEGISIEYLRQSVVRFIEIGLSKIVWASHDPELWTNVTKTASGLMDLVDHGIIADTDDLNDMYWSLLHRLRWFVSTTASNLQSEFFQEALQATQEKRTPLLMLEEQEEFMQTKCQALQKSLYNGLAKAQAHRAGLITDVIPA